MKLARNWSIARRHVVSRVLLEAGPGDQPIGRYGLWREAWAADPSPPRQPGGLSGLRPVVVEGKGSYARPNRTVQGNRSC